MKNTKYTYSNGVGSGAALASQGSASSVPHEATSESRPGSVKKQKQLQKTKDSLVAKQSELNTLVEKLEDRDTQQLAFTSLLELLPQLNSALVFDLYARVEKNRDPRRCSTRRMFVLVLAAMVKYHPTTAVRLLPRVLAYVSLRLRDKENQITDACAILCSAIALHVVPHACVNQKGDLSPCKKRALGTLDSATNNTSSLHTFENLVAHFSSEKNAVGEHATRCIANIIRPMEFDDLTSPPSDVIGLHGKRVAPFLRVWIQSLVSKMNESTQYAGFASTFLLLQAILGLAKMLKLDCDDRAVYDIVLPHVGSVMDAIEDVFRDGPRDIWILRKRGIELLIQLIDLYACGDTAEDNTGRQYFDHYLERVRRLVTEARHDPVSAVRDAALPAVFLFDGLAKLFPRVGEVAAPPSPFKRVCAGRGNSRGGSVLKGFAIASGGLRRRNASDEEKKTVRGPSADEETDANKETTFIDSQGDESEAPHEFETPDDKTKYMESVSSDLKLPSSAAVKNSSLATGTELSIIKAPVTKTKATCQRIKIPSIAAPKSPIKRKVVPFVPPNDDDDAFPEDHGDEHVADNDTGDSNITEPPHLVREAEVPNHDVQAIDEADEPATMTRAEAATVAAVGGDTDLAFRLCFLEDDMALLRRVLTLTGEPSASSLSRASRTALCAAFLEFLDSAKDARGEGESDDAWLAFVWLRALSREPRFGQQLDPRVLRALEGRLNYIAEQPTRAGLVAADILAAMGL